MDSSQAYIRDIESLYQMKDTFGYCADSMLKLLGAVDSYFNNVLTSLQEAVDKIKEQLDKAKENLERAEEALSHCESIQRYDEEEGEYVPSCRFEAQRVNHCQEEVNKWQKKLDEAKQILQNTKNAINDYHHKPSGLTSPGGEALIHCLATDTCQKADEKLVNIAEKLTEFASFQILEPGTEVMQEFRNEHRSDDDLPLDEEQKERQLKNAFENVRKEQESDSSSHHVANANGIMVCPVCGRPIALCVCKKC